MYWDSVKSEWEKEKQQILSVLTESNDELLDISLPIAEVRTNSQPVSLRNNHKIVLVFANSDYLGWNVSYFSTQRFRPPRNGLCESGD